MTNDKGFNDFGFKDVELPVSLRQIGNKRLKISQYCPKANKKSTSEAEDVYTS
jgi:hypothetical protein